MKKVLFVVLLCVALLALAGAYVPGSREFVERVFDQTAPIIAELQMQDEAFKVQLEDLKAGLDWVKITAEQGATIHEIYRENFPNDTKSRQISFPLNLAALGFKEGQVEVKVVTSDRALRASESSAAKNLDLDFSRPRLELLTLQHVAFQAGAELVLFHASDNNLSATGVKVGERTYPGFPASNFGVAADKEIYGALFALPFDFDQAKTKVTLFATDALGNQTSQDLHFRLGTFKQSDVKPVLSQTFLETKVPELYNQYLALTPNAKRMDISTSAGMIAAFKAVNEDYRALLDRELASLLDKNVTPRKGSGAFIKPMASATSSNLGERRSYSYGGRAISSSLHNGLDLASVKNDAVYAAQDGTVLLAKNFGIYGNAVVIDHGLGVSTLYGHLASISVKVGESVVKGGLLGQSGQTGLAGGDHLHFEIRVCGMPVTPKEWWDPKWIQDNIDGKLAVINSKASS